MKSAAVLLLSLCVPACALAQTATAGASSSSGTTPATTSAGPAGEPSTKKAVQASDKGATSAAKKKSASAATLDQDFEEVELVPRTATGEHNAKFQEYRDLSPGVSGGITYHREGQGAGYFRLDSHNLGLDDAYAGVEAGNYGSYRVRATYRQTPHNYTFGAMSLFSGAGSSTLTIDPSIQSTLQGVMAATPVTVAAGGGSNQAIVPLHGGGALVQANGNALTSDPLFSTTNALRGIFNSSALPIDLSNRRDKVGIDVDVPNKGDFDFGAYLSDEHRKGTLPYTGDLGQDDDLGFINELPAPVSYETNDHGVRMSYAHKKVYMGLEWEGSTFTNDNPNLLFSNAFRTTDAVPPVVATPPGILAGGVQPNPTLPVGILRGIPDITLSGSKNGLMPLPPNNDYNSYAFTAAVGDLPLKGRFTLNTTLGYQRNSSAFSPYTANSALLLTANIPAAAAGPNIPFALGNADNRVDTQFWLLRYTCQPWDWLHANAHYRSYDYQNNTPQYLVGKVIGDTNWETDPTGAAIVRQTDYFSYKKNQTGLDLAFDVFKRTVLTVAYENAHTDRTNRKVLSQNEDTYSASLDANPSSKLNTRVSYETAHRGGNYDETAYYMLGGVFDPASGGFVQDTGDRGWFPYLRQFDLAKRDHDRTRLTASWSPSDRFTLAGSVDDTNNVFPETNFGMSSEQDHGVALSADFSPRRRFNVSADFETRDFNTVQMSRHWKPTGDNWNGVATHDDPFTAQGSPLSSNSNWIAQDAETEHFWAFALRYDLEPERASSKKKNHPKHNIDMARLTTRYTYSQNDGAVAYSSAVGKSEGVFSAAGDDFNPFNPLPWLNVDKTKLYSLDTHMDLKFHKRFAATIGWLWEEMVNDDFNNTNFSNVNYIGDRSGTATGTVANQATTVTSSMLMGTWPTSYNANVYYATLKYRF